MSMEVKSINENDNKNRSRHAAEWHNIGKLYRVYMRQQKVGLFLGISAAFMMLCMMLKVILTAVDVTTNDGAYIQGINSGFTMLVMLYTMVLCGIAANILTNPVISIYPGTVKTRFLARIFYDCSIIILAVALAILFHFAGMGIFRLLAYTGKCVYSEILFDGKTFLMRSLLWLGYLFMLYFAFMLFHIIATKIGDTVLVIVCSLLFLALLVAWKLGYISVFNEIFLFYMGAGIGFGTALCRILVTVIILFGLSYAVMLTVHSWHESSKVHLGVSTILCYVIGMGVFMTSLLVFEESDAENENVGTIYTSTLEEDRMTGKVIVNDRIIRPGKVDAKKLNASYESERMPDAYYASLLEMGFSVGWCEYEQAKTTGLISDSQSLASGEMLVRVVANNDAYGVQGEETENDTYVPLFDRFIADLGVDIVDSEYVITFPKRVLLYDDFLTSMDRMLGRQAVTVPYIFANGSEETLRYCQVYIIYHAEDMDASEQIQNYDMVNGPYTWYLPEDWDTSDDEEED